MKEIGGYIELDTYHLPMLHEGAIALNCGRNCLAYLFKSRGIKKLKIPYFICSSVFDVCDREGVEKTFYHVGFDLKPAEDCLLEEGEWLYLVNFYGQLTNDEIQAYVDRYSRVIVDQANAYFQEPLPHVDTLYTCRKWFGVADGAFLYTDACLPDAFQLDESYDRMRFLLGRYERTASEFYGEYSANNLYFKNQPIKRMSKLTENLLHGIDYKAVEQTRRRNFDLLDQCFHGMNHLIIKPAAFMYPLMVDNGAELRKKLQAEKIYIPMLWPSVFKISSPHDAEYQMAENILPLPIDQRYGTNEMDILVHTIERII